MLIEVDGMPEDSIPTINYIQIPQEHVDYVKEQEKRDRQERVDRMDKEMERQRHFKVKMAS